MLTIEQFEDLDEGDAIEAPPIFSGITDEPTLMAVKTAVSSCITFDVSHMDVRLGVWECHRDGDTLTWVFR